jgi:hypothetical protein
MADLSGVTYAGVTGAFDNNYLKHSISTSDAGRTLIVKFAKTNITNAELNAWIAYLTTSHGTSGSGDSAFTVAGVGTADGSAFVSGTTDVVFLRLQGTGSFTDATVEALTGTPTVDIIAIFTPAL